MSRRFAAWTPGYSFVAQAMGRPPLNWNGQNYTDVNGLREGFGVTFHLQGGHSDWFHCPIATPVLVEDQRANLDKVFVLYNLPQGAAINSVHVWDGPNRVLQRDGLDLTGDHSRGIDADNFFPVNEAAVLWGIGISVLVSTISDADIHFTTAGADFLHDI